MIESRRQEKEQAIVIPTGLGLWGLAFLSCVSSAGARDRRFLTA